MLVQDTKESADEGSEETITQRLSACGRTFAANGRCQRAKDLSSGWTCVHSFMPMSLTPPHGRSI